MDLRILIDDATLNELEEIQKLFVTTVTDICKKDYTEEQIKAWSSAVDDKEEWAEKITNQYFLSAKAGDQIVGFASLKSTNYLDFLYVHKDFQGKGIAKKLLLLIERKVQMNRIDKINSDVSITAKPFFEKNGYKVIKEQKIKINDIVVPNFKMIKKLDFMHG